MARTARAGFLETRTSRLKLAAQKKPYFVRTGKAGVHLGYRRRQPKTGDANGSWVVRRYTGTGYETEVFADADDYSTDDGQTILTYHQAAQRLGGQLSEVQKRAIYTVAIAMDDWFLSYKARARSPVSVKQTEQKVRRIKHDLGAHRLDALTTDIIKKWRDSIASSPRRVKVKKGAPPKEVQHKGKNDAETMEIKRRRQNTANRLRAQLFAALNQAWQDGKVASADAWRRIAPIKGADQPRTTYLTSTEATQLVNAADPSFRPLIHAALLTGCRWSEIRNLRVSSFRSGAQTLTIFNSKGAVDRNVPLTDEGTAFFDGLTTGRRADELMFRKAGDQWGEADQVRRMLEACKAAEIVPAVGYHALRHTYGSLLAAAGVPMKVIADALGHADTRMTERHYAHIRPSYVSEQIRSNLPTFIAPKAGKARRARK